VIAAAVLCIAVLCTAGLLSAARSGEPLAAAPTPPAHSDRFVSPLQLDRAVAAAGPVTERLTASGPSFRAAVVPHHLVGGHLTAGLFAALARRPPEVVVIVGPDHFGAGPPVGTSRAAWSTAGGKVEADATLVSALLDRGAAEEAWDALDREHSVGVLIPFVKRYLPEARIVPLTVRGDVSFEKAARLGRLLAELAAARSGPAIRDGAPGGVFLIASVDFSHYLPQPEAARCDDLTMSALKSGDWGVLFAMGPAHLDSPASLAVAFAFTGRTPEPHFDVVWHANSAAVLGRPDLEETTSYFLLTIP